MEQLKIDISGAEGAVDRAALDALYERAAQVVRQLHEASDSGGEWLGWIRLPSSVGEAELAEIERVAAQLRSRAEVIVVVGIGGSYLGSRAVIEALSDSFAGLSAHANAQQPKVVFAGNNLSEDYLGELLEALKDKEIALVVVSKSGTTTEPAIAFRILKAEMERRYGREESARRTVAVTDARHGALRTMAAREGWASFVIPDDVGGRYSVLSAAGLLPIACAGFDIRELMYGAREMAVTTAAAKDNPAVTYAVARNALYDNGLAVEILSVYEPKLGALAEWWKQLFGESEGKNGKGIFPTCATMTADLHSIEQYIQDGRRMLFETTLGVRRARHKVVIGNDADNIDGLNYLTGRRLGEINHIARAAATQAHTAAGVPSIGIEIPEITPRSIGALIYFFEKSCAISGLLLGVNPFDQPGVEAYKRNMFRLLGKPRY
ncbi:MAG: glucose-6-phosphate isomerase [Rikenellaceae bacterium]|nr:glucose-6-phosphate isomerase [Rikenellaceae bacterium]MCL2692922.1 glucose-6-phosphate isomerase [Rikenellaceae bacterium]